MGNGILHCLSIHVNNLATCIYSDECPVPSTQIRVHALENVPRRPIVKQKHIATV